MVAITIKWNGFSRNESRSSISLDKDDVGIDFIVSVGDEKVVCTETGEKSPALGDKAGAKPEDGALAVGAETGARAEVGVIAVGADPSPETGDKSVTVGDEAGATAGDISSDVGDEAIGVDTGADAGDRSSDVGSDACDTSRSSFSLSTPSLFKSLSLSSTPVILFLMKYVVADSVVFDSTPYTFLHLYAGEKGLQ